MDLILLALAALGCDPPTMRLAQAESNVALNYLAEAELDLAASVDAFACGPTAAPTHVAQMLRAQAMVWYLRGETDRAMSTFAIARGLDPAFPTDYGRKAGELWVAAELAPPGTLDVRGLDRNEWVAIDGRTAPPVSEVPAGLHLLQVGRSSSARYASLVAAAAGASVRVSVPRPGEVAQEGRRRSPAILALAGGTGAVGAGLFGWATARYLPIRNSTLQSDVDLYSDSLLPAWTAGGILLTAGGTLAVAELLRAPRSREE